MLPKDLTPRARQAIAGLAALVPPLFLALFSFVIRSHGRPFPFAPTWTVVIALSGWIFVELSRAPCAPPTTTPAERPATGPVLSVRAYLAHACGFLTLVGLSAFPLWGIASLLGAAAWAAWANRARARAIGRASGRADGTTVMLALAGALFQAFTVWAGPRGSANLMDWIGTMTVAVYGASMIQVLYLAFPDGIIRRS